MKIVITERRAALELTPSWVDKVAVDRVLAGRAPGRTLSYAERVEVARRVDDPDQAPGKTAWTAAKLLGCSHSFATELVQVARQASAVAA